MRCVFCVADVCPPPVCLWDNQPLPATTETKGTGQECLSLTKWRMPRRTHTHTHKTKEHTYTLIHTSGFSIYPCKNILFINVHSSFGKLNFLKGNVPENAIGILMEAAMLAFKTANSRDMLSSTLAQNKKAKAAFEQ